MWSSSGKFPGALKGQYKASAPHLAEINPPLAAQHHKQKHVVHEQELVLSVLPVPPAVRDPGQDSVRFGEEGTGGNRPAGE